MRRVGAVAIATSLFFLPATARTQEAAVEEIVAISDPDSSLYVLTADGSDERRLVAPEYLNWEPMWSPDGTRIAYGDYDSDSLNVVDVNGAVNRVVADESMDGQVGTPCCGFSWSPDGEVLAYTAADYSEDFLASIWTVNADGTGRTRLTAHDEAVDSNPVWSPDGGRIAFVSDRHDPGERDWEVYVMDADGTGARRLTDLGPAGALGGSVAVYEWSRDGREILFIGDEDVWTVEPDTGRTVRVTRTEYPKVESNPTFSPDGSVIAFNRERGYCCFDRPNREFRWGYKTLDIFVVRRDTGSVSRLTDNAVADLLHDWSPSGDRLLYTKDIRRGGVVIKTMAPDGFNKMRLTQRSERWSSPDWYSP